MRAVAVGLGVIALAGCGGSDAKPLLPKGKVAAVRGSLTPDVHLFGEPVVAQVDVVVDRNEVNPDDVRVKTDFKPYETLGEPVTTREDIGGFTHLRQTTILRCFREDCIPRTVSGEVTTLQTPELPIFPEAQQRDEKRRYEFAPAVVTVGDETETKTLGRVLWPPLRSLSRINWYDPDVVGQGFPFVSTVTPLPEVTYRIGPTLLGALMLLVAFLLVALPVGYVVRSRHVRRAPGADVTRSLSPLERALALVEWASRRPSVDERREALEVLAYELDADHDETAGRARAQGWSPPAPAPEEMTELVVAVREDHASSA